MPTLPQEHLTLIMRFAPIFCKRIWHHVQVLVTGEILVRRKRTVTSVLRMMGLSDEPHFQNYPRVLNRPCDWCSFWYASRAPLGYVYASTKHQSPPTVVQ